MINVDDLATRFFTQLVGRVHGPMHFRLILQPVMAVIFATKDGIKDAHVVGRLISGDSSPRRSIGARC